MHKIFLATQSQQDIIDITGEVQKIITQENVSSGIAVVYSPHTTAGITVNENADPNVRHDITTFLNKLVPQNAGFTHMEGNSDAHIKGSLINFSQTFIIENGKLQLGTWQGIYYMEFDGPRNRQVWVKLISSS